MISLFNIPTFKVDTAKYRNLLHDKVVTEFEEKFAAYVGAKYAVSFNSATSAIFLLFLNTQAQCILPSVIPPVVPNAILNAGRKFTFYDNTSWVGSSYWLHSFDGSHKYMGKDRDVIDSAQRVDRNQFKKSAMPNDLMIFSFYPTKPVGSCDGGMIVSNDKKVIEYLREMTMNGMSAAHNNWERKINRVGHKMYMSSIQADMAMQSLKRLDNKKEKLSEVRYAYNKAFGQKNLGHHLYIVRLSAEYDLEKDRHAPNQLFIKKAKKAGIVCGIHYEALHHHPKYQDDRLFLPKSSDHSINCVSIPFHEKLTKSEIKKVIEFVNENRGL